MRNLTQNLSNCILVHEFRGSKTEVVRGNVQWCKYNQSIHQLTSNRGKYTIKMV